MTPVQRIVVHGGITGASHHEMYQEWPKINPFRCLFITAILFFILIGSVSAADPYLRLTLNATQNWKGITFDRVDVIDIFNLSRTPSLIESTSGDLSDLKRINLPQFRNLRRVFSNTSASFEGNTLEWIGPADSTLDIFDLEDYAAYTKHNVPSFSTKVPGETGMIVGEKTNLSPIRGNIEDPAKYSPIDYLYTQGTSPLYDLAIIAIDLATNTYTVSGVIAFKPEYMNNWSLLYQDLNYNLESYKVSHLNAQGLSDGATTPVPGLYFITALEYEKPFKTIIASSLLPIVIMDGEPHMTFNGTPTPDVYTYRKGTPYDIAISFTNPDVIKSISYVLIKKDDVEYDIRRDIDLHYLLKNAKDRWDTIITPGTPVITLLIEALRNDVGPGKPFMYNFTHVGDPTQPVLTGDISITPGYGAADHVSGGSTVILKGEILNGLLDGEYYLYALGLDSAYDVIAIDQKEVNVITYSRTDPYLRLTLNATQNWKGITFDRVDVIDIFNLSRTPSLIESTSGDLSDLKRINLPQFRNLRRVFSNTSASFEGNTLEWIGPADSTLDIFDLEDYSVYTKHNVPSFSTKVPGETGMIVGEKTNLSPIRGNIEDPASYASIKYLYTQGTTPASDPAIIHIYLGTEGSTYTISGVIAFKPEYMNNWSLLYHNLNYNLESYKVSHLNAQGLSDGATTPVPGLYFITALEYEKPFKTIIASSLLPIVIMDGEPHMTINGTPAPDVYTYRKGTPYNISISFTNPGVVKSIGYVLIKKDDVEYDIRRDIDLHYLLKNAKDRWDTIITPGTPVITLLIEALRNDVGPGKPFMYNFTQVGDPTQPVLTGDISITPGYGAADHVSDGSTVILKGEILNGLLDGEYYLYALGLDSAYDVIAIDQKEVIITGIQVYPIPNITSLSPSEKYAGESAFTLTINGLNFTSGCWVQWNGVNRTITSQTIPTQLHVTILANDIFTAGTRNITVVNPSPGGGPSNNWTFNVLSLPAPVLTSINPTSKVAGEGAFTLTLNGANFTSLSMVQWNGVSRTTIYVSSVQLQSTITAADIATAGTAIVRVINGDTSRTSNSLTFTVTDPNSGGGGGGGSGGGGDVAAPGVSGISTHSGSPGSSFSATVTGSNFMFGVSPTVTFTWSGATSGKTATKSFKATRVKVITGTEITCVVRVPRDAVQGRYNITVKNGDGQTGTLVRGFKVEPSPVQVTKPVLKSLSEDHLLVGSPAFSLVVTGSNFVQGTKTTNGSTVRWNGKTRATEFLSVTRLKAGVLASDLSRAGRVNVSVFTSGVGNSNSLPFTIANPAPKLLQVNPASAKAGTKSLIIGLRGNNFVRESRASWNGKYRQTQYLAPTMVNVKVLTSDLVKPGKVNLTVVSPGPGGGESGAVAFTVVR